MDKEYKKRTPRQNRSLHKFFTECTNEMNNSGITLKDFAEDLEIPMTTESTKTVFQGVCNRMFGKMHTSELTTIELQQAFEVFAGNLAMKGIVMGFPSFEDTDEYRDSLLEAQKGIAIDK